ncbi:putative ribonuclease H-like domain-containing protein [Tanacetum coccineum]
MAYSSTSSTSSTNSEVSNDSNCCSSCLECVKDIKDQNEQLVKDLRTARISVVSYKTGLESVEARLLLEAMQDELLQFKLQKVWTVMDLPNGKRAIGTKWVCRNKKDERGIVKNKARLVAQGSYSLSLCSRIEAIRLFLAYASFKDFVVYQMDVKRAFLYGKIKEEVYVCQPPRFEDPNFPYRVYKVEKALYGLHQAPRAWYETLFTYLLENRFQRGQIDKTLFIKRDQGDILIVQVYADDIIFGSTKNNFSDVKTASTPMETHKPLLKDADGEDVDEHMYRSMIGSLMYLTSLRPDIMFADSPFDLVAYTDSDYAGASLDRKSTTGGCQFLGCRLISWQCKKQTVVANSTTEAEYVAASSCCGQSTICIVKNPVFHSKTKHIEIRHHFIRDSNEKKLIQMIKIHTDKNVADLLTKAFDKGIGVNAGDLKLMLLGINLVLLVKVNAARHNLQLLVNINAVEVFLDKQVGDMTIADEIFVTPSHTKKVFGNMKKVGKGFSRVVTPLFPTMMVQAQEEMGEEPIADEAANEENVPTQSNDPPLSRVNTLGSGEDRLKLKELMDLCTKLSDRVLDLETTKTAQAKEIASLKKRVKKLERKRKSKTPGMKRLFKIGRSAQVVSSEDEGLGDQEDASKQGRKIDDIDQDVEVTLVDETQGRYDDAQMFDIDVFDGEEVFVAEQSEKVVEEVVSTAEVSAAATITTEEITLAQALAELRSAKPKIVVQEPVQSTTTTAPSTIPRAKGIVFHEQEQAPTPIVSSQQPTQVKDKGKGKMVEEEPVKKMSKKELLKLDEELAFKLQAEEEEQARLAREKAEKVEEANISWDNVQAMIEADRLLAERLQAREQEELTDEEKARLFVELLEKRKKHFAALRAQEKRNKPPTKAQKESTMSTYLKNMAGYKQSQLKNKSFIEIQKLFDKAMTRVNMFVDMDTELVKESSKKAEEEMAQESSSKRAGEELEQEVAKKQKMEDDKEKEDLKQCFEIV